MSATVCFPNASINLVVRTLYKTFALSNVDGNIEISELKILLHERGLHEHVPVPVASKQRLVFKGNVLTSGSLIDAGVRSGDHLVLLLHRPHASTSERHVDTTAVPTAATIRSAIIAEARRRGIENTIMEEQTRPLRHYGGVPTEVDQQLLQLIQALRGRPTAMEVRAGQPRQAGGAGGEGTPAAGQQQQQLAEAGAGGGRRRLQVGMMPAGMMLYGMPPPAAPAAAPLAPPPLPAIPEPNAQAAAQLGEMGFGEAVVRKALLLHRNDMEAALNWLLQHGEDPAAAEPLTDEQLRQIYSRGPRGPPSEPELVEQLVAMGFDRNQSAAALRRFRNMDMALAFLLRTAEEGGERQQQQEQEGGAEGATGAAAAAAGGTQAQDQEAGGQPRVGDPGAQPVTAPTATAAMAREDGRGEGMQAQGSHVCEGRRSDGSNSIGMPELVMSDVEGDDMDIMPSSRDGRIGSAAGAAERLAEDTYGSGQAGGEGQQRGADAPGHAQSMAVDGADDEQRGEGEGEERDDMDEDEEVDEVEEDHHEEEEEDEEEDEDDDFTGDDGPTMIEQLAMGQGGGGGRATVLQVPLGGGGLGLGGAALSDDTMAAMGAFEAPFVLYGGAPHGVGATTPAMAVTRGPDGNDLVLGSAGPTMPPLMPARGMMLGGMGIGGGGGPGAGIGLGPQPMDLPGLLQVGGAGEDELELQGMGLVQQLLNAVLRDAMGGGDGASGAAVDRR